MEGNDFWRSNTGMAGTNMLDDEGAGWSLDTLSVFSVSVFIWLDEASAPAPATGSEGPE